MGTSSTTFNFMSILILVFLVSYGICKAAGDVQAVKNSAADLQRVERYGRRCYRRRGRCFGGFADQTTNGQKTANSMAANKQTTVSSETHV
ncbi:hypothetical protein KP509_1Z184800 [Ceratopteris richardii]|nr:hypothetical protein KP509_1Z184800 [Ceratopteris richardii]